MLLLSYSVSFRLLDFNARPINSGLGLSVWPVSGSGPLRCSFIRGASLQKIVAEGAEKSREKVRSDQKNDEGGRAASVKGAKGSDGAAYAKGDRGEEGRE